MPEKYKCPICGQGLQLIREVTITCGKTVVQGREKILKCMNPKCNAQYNESALNEPSLGCINDSNSDQLGLYGKGREG